MKFAGYDAIIIKGKSEKPVYLWIHDDKVEFKDASYLWGLGLADTEQLIREELNDPYVRVAGIDLQVRIWSSMRGFQRPTCGSTWRWRGCDGLQEPEWCGCEGHQKFP